MIESRESAALLYLSSAKSDVKMAASYLAGNGETDEAAMKTLAVIDAIDCAKQEIELRLSASSCERGQALKAKDDERRAR